jgi:hypothetical protein
MTRAELDVSDRLAQIRDTHARELGIDPTLIASKATLYALGRKDPDAWEGLMPWQRNLLENPQTSSRPAPTRAPALETSNAPDAADDDEERQLPLCGLD